LNPGVGFTPGAAFCAYALVSVSAQAIAAAMSTPESRERVISFIAVSFPLSVSSGLTFPVDIESG